MRFTLDHIILAVDDLDAARAHYTALGFTVIPGGRHASGTTHNALICLQDGTYIELMSPTGDSPVNPDAPDYSSLVRGRTGLAGYALLSIDLDADAAALRGHSVEVGAVQPGQRTRPDGVLLRWKTAALNGGMSPFLIEDVTPRNLRVPDDEATVTHANGAVSMVDVGRILPELADGLNTLKTELP